MRGNSLTVPSFSLKHSQIPTEGEEIQEDVKNDVINISPEILGIVKEEAEKYPEPPKTYEQYRAFLLGNGLEEYIDGETAECDYFYYWYRILSAKELPENITYGHIFSNLKSYFSPGEINRINILFSLYQSTYESTDFDAMEGIHNEYAKLILVMAIRYGLLSYDFHNEVNYADLFSTFTSKYNTELDVLFFAPVLGEGKEKRGYKKVIETIQKEFCFFASLKYRKLFDETSKKLVQKLLKRYNFAYPVN